MPLKLDPYKPQSIVSKFHKDHKNQNDQLLKILNELLCECHNTFDKPTKIKKIDVLFSWLSKNLHLFENFGLLNIVKLKIMEFATDPMGKVIHDKYGWMLDLHSPPGKYSSFGRKITTLYNV